MLQSLGLHSHREARLISEKRVPSLRIVIEPLLLLLEGPRRKVDVGDAKPLFRPVDELRRAVDLVVVARAGETGELLDIEKPPLCLRRQEHATGFKGGGCYILLVLLFVAFDAAHELLVTIPPENLSLVALYGRAVTETLSPLVSFVSPTSGLVSGARTLIDGSTGMAGTIFQSISLSAVLVILATMIGRSRGIGR